LVNTVAGSTILTDKIDYKQSHFSGLYWLFQQQRRQWEAFKTTVGLPPVLNCSPSVVSYLEAQKLLRSSSA